MALSDLISRPLINPLEGLSQGIQTGVEIAAQKERLAIANQELVLRKQQTEAEYLAKGISAMGALSKAKGANRKVLGDVMLKYFANGNLRINEQTAKLLSSDTQYAKKTYDILQDMKRRGITDPTEQYTFIQGVVDADPDQVEQLLKLKEIQIKEQAEASSELSKALQLESVKAGFKVGQTQAEEQLKRETERVSEAAGVSIPLSLEKAMKGMTPEESSKYKITYRQIIGQRVADITKGLTGLTGVNKGKVNKLQGLLFQAQDQFVKDPEVAQQKLREADLLYGEIQTEKQADDMAKFNRNQARLEKINDDNQARRSQDAAVKRIDSLDKKYATLDQANVLIQSIESGNKKEIDRNLPGIMGFISGTRESLGRVSDRDLSLMLPNDKRAQIVGLLDSLTGKTAAQYSQENIALLREQFLRAEKYARTLKVYELQKELYNGRNSAVSTDQKLYAEGGSIYNRYNAAINKEIGTAKSRGIKLYRLTDEQIAGGEVGGVLSKPKVTRLTRKQAEANARSVLGADATSDAVSKYISEKIRENAKKNITVVIED